jgi:nuclease S1
MKPRRLRVVLLVLLGLVPAPLLAWAQLGHRLVAELASAHLTPPARAQVASLLAGEPDPTLGAIASWADGLRESDPQRFKATSPWHYINSQDGSCDFMLERDCPDGRCIVAAIEAQRRILANRGQSRAVRRDALKFLVHLVADVHQPLHATSRRDSGGNQFQVGLRTELEPEPWERRNYTNGVVATNLHAIWDYYVLASARLSAPRYLTLLQSRMPARQANGAGAALLWARESCVLIDARKLYPQQHVMDRAYLTAMRPLAEGRIQTAAQRLAALLNESLKQD